LKRTDWNLLVPAARFPYILSYATDGSRYYKLATLRFVAYYKRFSLISVSRLLYIYMYKLIFIYAYMYIYIYYIYIYIHIHEYIHIYIYV